MAVDSNRKRSFSDDRLGRKTGKTHQVEGGGASLALFDNINKPARQRHSHNNCLSEVTNCQTFSFCCIFNSHKNLISVFLVAGLNTGSSNIDLDLTSWWACVIFSCTFLIHLTVK